MEEDELVKGVDSTREMPSNEPSVGERLQTENAKKNQNKIFPDTTTKKVLLIDTAKSDVTSNLPEENITDEENASTIEEEPGPPTPPTEVESDMSIVVSETSKQSEVNVDNRENPPGEDENMVEKEETEPMNEEAETESMDEEAETQPMNEVAETQPIDLQSTSGREVESNSLLIVSVVGSIQKRSTLISTGKF